MYVFLEKKTKGKGSITSILVVPGRMEKIWKSQHELVTMEPARLCLHGIGEEHDKHVPELPNIDNIVSKLYIRSMYAKTMVNLKCQQHKNPFPPAFVVKARDAAVLRHCEPALVMH